MDADGRAVIERATPVAVRPRGARALTAMERADSAAVDAAYEIPRTAAAITAGGYKRVALQFPDELLSDAAAVASRLTERTEARCVVLADTTYGSYDVDEVAAEHADADLVVHYGPAALSATARLPVLFVFGQAAVDVDDCSAAAVRLLLADAASGQATSVLVMADLAYAHAVLAVADRLRVTGQFAHVVAAETVGSWRLDGSVPVQGQRGRWYTLPDGMSVDAFRIWYLGPDSPTLTNVLVTHPRSPVFTYDPEANTARRETADVNRLLKRRRYLIQQTKDAGVIGIVVTALGVEGYLDVATTLKRLIRAVGKRAFTFVMGKLNVAKMANFMEVDVFVLVASPENSLIDTRDFIKPVVTPWDAWVALAGDGHGAGNELVTDFRELQSALRTAADTAEATAASGTAPDDAPEYSFVSGTFRPTRTGVPTTTLAAAATDGDGIVAVRDAATSVTAYTAPDYLAGRLFRGLDPRLGATPVTLAIEGSDGIARGYANEAAYQPPA